MYRSIQTVFKKIHPDKQLTMDALICISDHVDSLLTRLLHKQTHLSLFSIKEDMENVLHPVLFPYIQKEIDTTFNKYYQTGTTKEHIDFSVNAIKKWLKNKQIETFCYTDVLYIATCIEYLCSEICELSGNVARDHRKVRVTCDHVEEAIVNDGPLSHTFKSAKKRTHRSKNKR